MLSSDFLICIPTYNESTNILQIIERFRSFTDAAILVIDDNSPDGTAKIVEDGNFANTFVLKRSKKEGLGPAYLAGFTWGLERDFQYFVECDADGSHQPEELPRLISAVEGCDLVIGTRWMPGGKVENWPLIRKAISRIGTKYAQIALGLPYKDLTSGYRIISRKALSTIPFTEISSHGYGFQIEMAMRIHNAGFPIAQTPITFIERTRGQSKMSKRIVLEALIQTTKWAIQRIVKTR